MLTIVETHFASIIIMRKRFKAIKRGLQNILSSEKNGIVLEKNDVQKAQFVKENVLDN